MSLAKGLTVGQGPEGEVSTQNELGRLGRGWAQTGCWWQAHTDGGVALGTFRLFSQHPRGAQGERGAGWGAYQRSRGELG